MPPLLPNLRRLLVALALAGVATGGMGATAGPATGAVSAAAAPATPAAARPASPWSWPLPGEPTVTRRFDRPDTDYGPGHRGVDLGADAGTPVLAAGNGTVGYAGMLAGRGVVTVVHGELRTTYEPVSVSVHRGQRVTGGDVLGRLAGGHPGCPVSACLHWGLLHGRTYRDPLTLLGRGPVRLLPLSAARTATRERPAGRDAMETDPTAAPPPAAVARDRPLPLRPGLRASTAAALLLLGAGVVVALRSPRT